MDPLTSANLRKKERASLAKPILLRALHQWNVKGASATAGEAEDPSAGSVSLSTALLYGTLPLPFQASRTSSEGSSATLFSFRAAFHSLHFTCLFQRETWGNISGNGLQCKHMSFNSLEIGVASQPFFCLQCRRPRFSSSVRKKKGTLHTSVFLLGEFHTEEPGGLQSMGSQGVRNDWMTNTH